MGFYQDKIIAPNDKASKLAKEICYDSFSNCPAVNIIPRQPGNFRGPVDFRWERHIYEAMMNGKMAER